MLSYYKGVLLIGGGSPLLSSQFFPEEGGHSSKLNLLPGPHWVTEQLAESAGGSSLAHCFPGPEKGPSDGAQAGLLSGLSLSFPNINSSHPQKNSSW